MTSEIRDPGLEMLLAEQAEVQAHKFQGRQLDEYTRYIFPGQTWREPRSSAVTDFLSPYCIGDTVTLEGVLEGVHAMNPDKSVVWADMGGGRGLPMRELAARGDGSWLTKLDVDLFDFGLEGLTEEEIAYLEDKSPGITSPENAPTVVLGDATTMVLPLRPDVVTSVEGVQYLNDPLKAIAGWYNQLHDNGLLIVSAEHDWASWIRYQREPGEGDRDKTPTKNLLDELGRKGIDFAASYEADYESGHRPDFNPGEFRNMVIRKRPGTSLVLNAALQDVWVNPWNFKASYYDESMADQQPLVEVVTS